MLSILPQNQLCCGPLPLDNCIPKVTIKGRPFLGVEVLVYRTEAEVWEQEKSWRDLAEAKKLGLKAALRSTV